MTTTTEANPELNRSGWLSHYGSLIGWILLVFTASALGSFATSSGLQEWFATLQKPSFQPPNWLFGPVWSCLYLMMAISAWMIWRESNPAKRSKRNQFLILFMIQLSLNVLWSVLFFGLQSPGWAFVEICILWAMIVATIAAGYRVQTWAGHLLLPYIAWVSFALVLNFAIYQLNVGS